MTLGSWLSAYPPLSERVELLAPALGASLPANTQGPQRAAGILALLIVLPTVAFVAVGAVWVMALTAAGSTTRGAGAASPAARSAARSLRPPLPPLFAIALTHTAPAATKASSALFDFASPALT